jgi:hypothetical protein
MHGLCTPAKNYVHTCNLNVRCIMHALPLYMNLDIWKWKGTDVSLHVVSRPSDWIKRLKLIRETLLNTYDLKIHFRKTTRFRETFAPLLPSLTQAQTRIIHHLGLHWNNKPFLLSFPNNPAMPGRKSNLSTVTNGEDGSPAPPPSRAPREGTSVEVCWYFHIYPIHMNISKLTEIWFLSCFSNF